VAAQDIRVLLEMKDDMIEGYGFPEDIRARLDAEEG
jgi:hypothetical protein